MKKYKKILLLGICFLFSIMFVNKVHALEIEYPEVGNGTEVYYNKEYGYVCSSSADTSCKTYAVSEDDGTTDDKVKLTNKSDINESFEISKTELYNYSGWYISAKKQVDVSNYLKLEKDEYGNEYSYVDTDALKGASGVETIKFFVLNPSNLFDITLYFSNIVKNANPYDIIINNSSIFSSNSYLFTFEIPKDVTLIANFTLDGGPINVINNGTIYTSEFYIRDLTGSGEVNALLGDFFPICFSEINGPKINFIGKELKEGLDFGKNFTITDEYFVELIDKINNNLGSKMEGYQLKLETRTNEYDEYESNYTVVLEKKTGNISTTVSTKIEAKQEIKNPSTKDTFVLTIIMVIVSGIALVVSYKKVK